MGVVFRARDRLNGQDVALKRVLRQEEEPLPPAGAEASRHGTVRSSGPETAEAQPLNARLAHDATLRVGARRQPTVDTVVSIAQDQLGLALGREFRTLASLRHPNIVSVFDYGFEAPHRPFFTMELLRDAQPLFEVARDLPIDARVRLLLSVLQALSYLHRRGVLHRDLKPANVLVSNGRVVVLDFGLAVLRGTERLRQAELAGTLPYMAQELLLGDGPSVASDLYSFGVMATQLLTGHLPFEGANSELLVSKVLTDEPRLFDAPLAPRLLRVLESLLHRDPAARPVDAAAAAQALSTAAGVPLPSESAQVRDSYLQAAQFVGRDNEMATLRAVLNQASRGRGGLWLVGGESGVGKTRLLDEVRTMALVRGAQVDRSQAVTEGGSAFQLFAGALRSAALSVTLSPLEAGTLKSILPDLPQLLEQAVADAPEVDAQAARARLLGVVCDVLRRRPEPVVLILEDLQWAPDDALEVLRRLQAGSEEHPLLILGSYRDDERPHLPQELPGAQRLPLQRLTQRAIVSLIEAMLGSAGLRPDFVSWLGEQTEGNPFFLVEILRALAEDRGRLADIGASGVGEWQRAALQGGLATVVARRLARVPESAMPLLRLAAIAGRRLELPLLRHLGGALEDWLSACADAAVLDFHDGHWQFSHDKLREGILTGLTPAEARSLHLRVAEALERISLPTPTPAALLALAFHMEAAGRIPTAFGYALRAGEVSLSRGALQQAAELLGRALRMEAQAEAPLLERVRTRRLLGLAMLALGNIAACMRVTEEGLGLLGITLPAGGRGLGRSLLSEAAQQGLLRLRDAGSSRLGALAARLARRWGAAAGPDAAADGQPKRAELDEAYGLYATHGEGALYLCADERLLHCALGCVNIADRTGDVGQRIFSYSAMAYTSSLLPLPSLAALYLRRADPLRQMRTGTRGEFEFLRLRCAVHINQGRFEDARTDADSALRIARAIGDDGAVMFAIQQCIWVELFRKRYDDLDAEIDQLRAVAERSRQDQFQAWARAYRAAVTHLRGGHGAALTDLDSAIVLGRKAHDLFFELYALSQRARVSVALQSWGDARADADAALGLYQVTPMLAYGVLDSIHGLVDVCLALLRHAPPVIRPAQRKRLLRAMGFQKTLARHLIIAQAPAADARRRLAELDAEQVRG